MRSDSLEDTKTHNKYGVKANAKRPKLLRKACESWGYVDCFIHIGSRVYRMIGEDSAYDFAVQKKGLFFMLYDDQFIGIL